jgi:hypothetical protein
MLRRVSTDASTWPFVVTNDFNAPSSRWGNPLTLIAPSVRSRPEQEMSCVRLHCLAD